MVLLQVTVTGADRIWVKMKTPRQFARAGQSLPGLKLAAEDAQNDLRDQLVANTDFVAAGEPEPHGVHGKPWPQAPANLLNVVPCERTQTWVALQSLQ